MKIRGDRNTEGRGTMGRTGRFAALFCALALSLPALAGGAALAADREQTAAIPPASPTADFTSTSRAVPDVLSVEDETRYRRIFAAQDRGDWKTADAEIAALTDKALMGPVLAQRYLHPRAYRASFKEMAAWLRDYADQPQADRIYDLAKRKGGTKAGLTPPQITKLKSGAGKDVGTRWENSFWQDYGKAGRSLRDRFAKAIRGGQTLGAKKILESAEAKKQFHRIDYDRMAGVLGFKYFIDGRDDLTHEWAGTAADRSGGKAPMAVWAAGLASWRQGDFAKAAARFEALATSEHASPWMTTAGAYWAARAHLRARAPEKVNPLLEAAARHPRTFYGLLAHQALGTEPVFNWQADDTVQSSLAALTTDPQGHRALALLQIGRKDEAEKELRSLYARADGATAEAVVAVADAAHLSSLAMRLSTSEIEDDPWPRDAASYPMPSWSPNGGWRLDKALVFAFVRQESGFNPQAKSPRGAAGLMQLMPATASFIARDRGLRGKDAKALFDPSVNLKLGQSYLEHLLHNDQVNGNLFFLAAAYNGGPGNLSRWLKTMDYQGDPLLFIESLPSRETRIFIERVLSNLWIYRKRFDQPEPSLALLVSGEWPLYTHLDDPNSQQVAKNDLPH